MEIEEWYGLKVERMGVGKEVVGGERVEMGWELKGEGKFEGRMYRMGYFEDEGKGWVRMEKGRVLEGKEGYVLEKEKLGV